MKDALDILFGLSDLHGEGRGFNLFGVRYALVVLDAYVSCPRICRCILPPNTEVAYQLSLNSNCPLSADSITGPAAFNIDIRFGDVPILVASETDAVTVADLKSGVPVVLKNCGGIVRKVTPELAARNAMTGVRDPIVTRELCLREPPGTTHAASIAHPYSTSRYCKTKLGTDEEQDKEIAEKTRAMNERVSQAELHSKIAGYFWELFKERVPLWILVGIIKITQVLPTVWVPGRPFPTARVAAYHRLREIPANLKQARMFSVGDKEKKALEFLLREAVSETFLQLWDERVDGLPFIKACLFLALRHGSALGRVIVDAPELNQLYQIAYWSLPGVQEVIAGLQGEDTVDNILFKTPGADLVEIAVRVLEEARRNIAERADKGLETEDASNTDTSTAAVTKLEVVTVARPSPFAILPADDHGSGTPSVLVPTRARRTFGTLQLRNGRAPTLGVTRHGGLFDDYSSDDERALPEQIGGTPSSVDSESDIDASEAGQVIGGQNDEDGMADFNGGELKPPPGMLDEEPPADAEPEPETAKDTILLPLETQILGALPVFPNPEVTAAEDVTPALLALLRQHYAASNTVCVTAPASAKVVRKGDKDKSWLGLVPGTYAVGSFGGGGRLVWDLIDAVPATADTCIVGQGGVRSSNNILFFLQTRFEYLDRIEPEFRGRVAQG